jgi:hypothetical protein
MREEVENMQEHRGAKKMMTLVPTAAASKLMLLVSKLSSGIKLNSPDFQRGGFTEDESLATMGALAEAITGWQKR